MTDLLLQYLGITIAYMTIWFYAAVRQKNNSIVDIAWGIGFIVLALWSYCVSNFDTRQKIVTTLVFIWGIRLAMHIQRRNSGKHEDFRYAEMRERWGKLWILESYIRIFFLQGVMMFLVALPILCINSFSNRPLTFIDVLGIALWSIGMFFESIGDYQLVQFKKNPQNKGGIMNSGLWKYTRHPNYFGESIIWWGIWLIAVSVPFGWTTILSPMLITFLLVHVSGVPMLEKKYKDNAEYQDYIQKTSSFIPMPPKE